MTRNAAILCTMALALQAHARGQDRVEERLERIYARGGYERQLVEDPGVEAPNRSGLGAGRRRSAPAVPSADPPGWLATLLHGLVLALPWIAAGIILVALLAVLVRRRSGPPSARHAPERPRPAASTSVEGPADLSPPRAADGTLDPEALARDGRYTEAIHVLLLDAIGRVARRAPRVVKPAHTSREVARNSPLDPRSKGALDRIVRAVEVSVFGGRPADQVAYEDCSAALQEIGAAA